jgi:hypothetical protein
VEGLDAYLGEAGLAEPVGDIASARVEVFATIG